MLIIGAYPKSLDYIETRSHIQDTTRLIQKLAPKDSVVHLLPFCPSSGDYGFAPDDICNIDATLGDIQDVSELAKKFRCIFDGIYNHVGNGHEWVKKFGENPIHFSRYLHAYYSENQLTGPSSPRGQPALQVATDSPKGWYLWRTFTQHAVDIRLDAPEVIHHVKRHLNFLQKIGAWGVRLDAVAYYKKDIDGDIRHNPGVYEIAEKIATVAYNSNLEVFAQINRDAEGLAYFTNDGFSEVVINDFTYTAYLLLALFKGEASLLVDYDNSCNDSRRCIRAPRTHDGILLRSKAMPIEHKQDLTRYAKELDLPVRLENGEPYEINCSLPYIFSKIFPEYSDRATELAIVITGMSSGLTYLYLPLLLNYCPEMYLAYSPLSDISDPRALNRHPISSLHLKKLTTKKWMGRCKRLLHVLSEIRSKTASQNQVFRSSLNTHAESVLISTTQDGEYRLVANLSNKKVILPPNFLIGKCLVTNSENSSNLEPLQFYLNKIN